MIDRIEITNFREIKKLAIDFKKVTVLCGMNGAGKTSVLHAIQYALLGRCGDDWTARDGKGVKAFVGKYGNHFRLVLFLSAKGQTGGDPVRLESTVYSGKKSEEWCAFDVDGEIVAESRRELWRYLGRDYAAGEVSCFPSELIASKEMGGELMRILSPEMTGSVALDYAKRHGKGGEEWLDRLKTVIRCAVPGGELTKASDWERVGNHAHTELMAINKELKQEKLDIVGLRAGPAMGRGETDEGLKALVDEQMKLSSDYGRASALEDIPERPENRDELVAEIGDAEAKIGSLRAEYDSPGTAAFDAAEKSDKAKQRATDRLASLVGEELCARVRRVEIDADIECLTKKIGRFEECLSLEALGDCVTCGRPHDKASSAIVLQGLLEELEVTGYRLDQLKDAIKEARASLGRANTLCATQQKAAQLAGAQREEQRNEIGMLTFALNGFTATLAALDKHREALEAAPWESSEEIKEKLGALVTKISEAKDTNKQAQSHADYLAAEVRIADMTESAEIFMWCKTHFGVSKGVASRTHTGEFQVECIEVPLREFTNKCSVYIEQFGYHLGYSLDGGEIDLLLGKAGEPANRRIKDCSQGEQSIVQFSIGAMFGKKSGLVLIDNLDGLDYENIGEMFDALSATQGDKTESSPTFICAMAATDLAHFVSMDDWFSEEDAAQAIWISNKGQASP